MTTKDKLIEEIRAVPIVDKTYSEYVEAVADHILAEGILEKSIQYRIIKKACNDVRKAAAREILALVWEAYNTTHYDAEFEERLDKIENKYTESSNEITEGGE